MKMVEVGKDRNLEARRFTTVACEPHALVPVPRKGNLTNHISSPPHFQRISETPCNVSLYFNESLNLRLNARYLNGY